MKISPTAVLLMASSSHAFNGFKNAVTRVARSRTVSARMPMAMFSTTTASTSNALLEQESLPKFASIDPSQLTPAVSETVEKLEKDFAAFEEKIASDGFDATYDNVLPELERMQFPLGYGKLKINYVYLYMYSEEQRNAQIVPLVVTM